MVKRLTAVSLKRAIVSFFLFTIFSANEVIAYPTLARHGYTTCATCHYNPSGGGILTSYGKYIAGELFGFFNNSSSAFPWLVEPKEDPMFDFMFMSRGAQTYFDTPQLKKMDFRRMQFDIEGGYVKDGWQLLGALGPRLDSAIEDVNKKDTIDLRRYWIGRVDVKYSIRLGKFFPEYGINHPNHNIPTRRGMFFNHNEEPYNLHGSYFGEYLDFSLGLLKGARHTQLEDKKGGSLTISHRTGMKRYGVSALKMTGATTSTHGSAIFAQIGFYERGVTLLELDLKSKVNAKGKATNELLGYFETGWEVYRGLNPYIAAEYSENQTQNTWLRTPKIGMQFHPITHTEIVLEVGKRYQNDRQEGTQAYGMANFYF